MTDLLQFHDTASMDEELLMDKQRKRFCETEFTTCEDAMGIVTMTTKDLESYINSVVKSVAGLRKIYCYFEKGSTVDKML